MQKLCRDKKLAPEKTVCVPGIGCSSRLPHYMEACGFHGVHGRALPLAEGAKLRRARAFGKTMDGPVLGLADILKADFATPDDAHDRGGRRGTAGSRRGGRRRRAALDRDGALIERAAAFA